METATRDSYLWWFDRQSHSHGRSQWLQSTLSELDERTKSMLKIIDQEADSFAQRAEMYYEKRPQLISLIEDFYRTHRSLAIRFDHLKQDPATRGRTSSLARSSSLSMDGLEKAIVGPRRSFDGGSREKEKLAYDSDSDSIGSEVDDPSPVLVLNHDLMDEIKKLKEEAMVQKRKLEEKETEMEEMKRRLDELKEEAEKLRQENVEMDHMRAKDAEEKERLRMELVEERGQLVAESERRKEVIEEKDNEKRQAIRQLCLAMEMLRSENLVLRKLVVNEGLKKKWNPFEFHGLKGFRKLFRS